MSAKKDIPQVPPTKVDEDTINNNLIKVFEKINTQKDHEIDQLKRKIQVYEAKLSEQLKLRTKADILEAENERLNDLVMEQARQVGKLTFYIEEQDKRIQARNERENKENHSQQSTQYSSTKSSSNASNSIVMTFKNKNEALKQRLASLKSEVNNLYSPQKKQRAYQSEQIEPIRRTDDILDDRRSLSNFLTSENSLCQNLEEDPSNSILKQQVDFYSNKCSELLHENERLNHTLKASQSSGSNFYSSNANL